MNLRTKRDMYSMITDRQHSDNITLREASDLYAKTVNQDPDMIWNEFNTFSNEVEAARASFNEKLSNAIQKSKDKTISLKGVVAPAMRQFDSWENEIITLAYKAFPDMSQLAISEYLSEMMPHRTAKAYNAYQNRANILGEHQSIVRTVKSETPTSSREKIQGSLSQSDVEDIYEGNIVDCTVAAILPYGALLITDSGAKGLLHKSEISNMFVHHVSDHLYEGQRLRAKVITDPKGRLSFSTRVTGISKDMVKEETPVATFKVSEKVSEQVVSKLASVAHENVIQLKDLTSLSFTDIPNVVTDMITVLKADRKAIDEKISVMEAILKVVEREHNAYEKLESIKKYFVEA